MLVNSSSEKIFSSGQQMNLLNSFIAPYINFYNIGFKINNTSIIKLDDEIVNYLLPISTQQYFVYSNDYNLYAMTNNNSLPILSQINEVSQLTFNSSYDNFNLFCRNIY